MTSSPFVFDNARLRQFYEYWLGKGRNGRLPGRQDIDPVQIPELLPWMILVDPVPADSRVRFRIRLVGTGIVARAGRDATGKWYEELFAPRDVERFTEIYAGIMASGQPHHFRSDYDIERLQGREHIRYERLLCPLATDGQTVDMLAGVVAFIDDSA
jgi:hypothetical protein